MLSILIVFYSCSNIYIMFIIEFSVIFQVTDSKGHFLYNKENIESGKFAFNTEAYDVYEVCFISKVPPSK